MPSVRLKHGCTDPFSPPSQARVIAHFAARLPAAQNANWGDFPGKRACGQTGVLLPDCARLGSAPLWQNQAHRRRTGRSRWQPRIWAVRARAKACAIIFLLFLSPRVVPGRHVTNLSQMKRQKKRLRGDNSIFGIIQTKHALHANGQIYLWHRPNETCASRERTNRLDARAKSRYDFLNRADVWSRATCFEMNP